MTKLALLKTSTAVDVIKSAEKQEKLPATKPERGYAHFDAFVANADKLVAFFSGVDRTIERLDLDDRFEWIKKPDYHSLDFERVKQDLASAKYAVQTAKSTLSDFPRMRKRLAEFKRDERWYNRKELYEIKGKGKRQQSTLSRRVVTEQIALLLASFQNSRPGTPKVFGRMLTEEVYANSPNACVLESACRLVRRTKDFPPSIAEVLKAIKEEGHAWCDRWEWLDPEDGSDSDEYFRPRLESAIAEAEAIIAKAEAKLTEREAKAKTAEEERKAYWEAYNRIPEAQRKAHRDGQDDARCSSFSKRTSAAKYIGQEPGVLDAYLAGLTYKPIPGLEIKTNGAGEIGG